MAAEYIGKVMALGHPADVRASSQDGAGDCRYNRRLFCLLLGVLCPL